MSNIKCNLITKQTFDKICLDKSLSRSIGQIEFINKEGVLSHPIMQDLKLLNKLLSYDKEYSRHYCELNQCCIDTKGDIIIYDYQLKSYDDIISSNGQCMWLDSCNIFRCLALKYNAQYKIIDNIIYVDKIIIHQMIEFIIFLSAGFVRVMFDEAGMFYRLYPYSSYSLLHEQNYETNPDDAISIAEALGIDTNEEKVFTKTIDITNFQLQDINIKEFNSKLLSMIY
jgi:hypothetical protein